MMLFTWACNVLPHAAWLGAVACLPLAVLMLIDRQRRPQWEQEVVKVSLLILVFSLGIAVWYCRPSFSTVESWTEVKTISMPVAPVTTAQVAAPVSSPVIEVPSVQTPTDWKTRIGALWILGILGFAVLHLCAWFRLRLTLRRAIAPPPNLTSAFEALRKTFGVQVRLLVTTHKRWTGPAIIGLWRPVILVPATLLNLQPQELEMLLRHELAHIARRDAWWNFLAIFLETVLFFHPGIWWMTRRLRVTRERLADELALSSDGDRQILAEALLNLAEGSIPRTVLAARGGELSERIRALVKVGSPRRPVLVIPALMALALTIGGFIACGRQRTPIIWDPMDPAIGEIEEFMEEDSVWKSTPKIFSRERRLAATNNALQTDARVQVFFLNDQQFQRLNLGFGAQKVVATKDLPNWGFDETLHPNRAPEMTMYPLQLASYSFLTQLSFVASYKKLPDNSNEPQIKNLIFGDIISLRMEVNGKGILINEGSVDLIKIIACKRMDIMHDDGKERIGYPFEVPLVRHFKARVQRDTLLQEDQTLILTAPVAKLETLRANWLLSCSG